MNKEEKEYLKRLVDEIELKDQINRLVKSEAESEAEKEAKRKAERKAEREAEREAEKEARKKAEKEAKKKAKRKARKVRKKRPTQMEKEEWVILYFLYRYGATRKNSLLAVVKNEEKGRKGISKAKEKGLIEEKGEDIKIYNKKRKESYYKLTEKGKNYIRRSKRYEKAIGKRYKISLESRKKNVIDPKEHEEIERQLRASQSNIFMRVSGVRAKEEVSKECENGADIKITYESLADLYKKVKEVEATGLMRNQGEAVTIYSNSKNGIDFKDKRVAKEKEAIKKRTGYDSEIRAGILIVNTKVSFEKMYRDNFGKREAEEFLGKGYESFIVFPCNRKGVINFKEYAYRYKTAEEYRKAKALKLCKGGKYKENKGEDRELFPLLTEKGEKIYIGTIIDTIKMRELEEYKETVTQSEEEIKILCYSWQKEYYKAIFPNYDTEMQTRYEAIAQDKSNQ